MTEEIRSFAALRQGPRSLEEIARSAGRATAAVRQGEDALQRMRRRIFALSDSGSRAALAAAGRAVADYAEGWRVAERDVGRLHRATEALAAGQRELLVLQREEAGALDRAGAARRRAIAAGEDLLRLQARQQRAMEGVLERPAGGAVDRLQRELADGLRAVFDASLRDAEDWKRRLLGLVAEVAAELATRRLALPRGPASGSLGFAPRDTGGRFNARPGFGWIWGGLPGGEVSSGPGFDFTDPGRVILSHAWGSLDGLPSGAIGWRPLDRRLPGGPGAGAGALAGALLPGVSPGLGAIVGRLLGNLAGGLFGGGGRPDRQAYRVTAAESERARSRLLEEFRSPFGRFVVSGDSDAKGKVARAMADAVRAVDLATAGALDTLDRAAVRETLADQEINKRFRQANGREVFDVAADRLLGIAGSLGLDEEVARREITGGIKRKDKNIEALVAQGAEVIGFVGGFERSLAALEGGLESVDELLEQQVLNRLTATEDHLREFTARTEELGLGTDAAAAASRAFVERMVGIREAAESERTASETALLELQALAENIGPLMEQVGIAAEDAADGIAGLRDQLAEGFMESVADQLLALQRPGAAALRAFERDRAAALRREAAALAEAELLSGAELVEVERLIAAERLQVLERYADDQRDLLLEIEDAGDRAAAGLGAFGADMARFAAGLGEAAARAADDLRRLESELAEGAVDLMFGETSALSARAQTGRARAIFADLAERALAGDGVALGELRTAGERLLDASRAFNGSTVAYAADFELVIGALEQASAVAAAEAAEQQAIADRAAGAGEAFTAAMAAVAVAIRDNLLTEDEVAGIEASFAAAVEAAAGLGPAGNLFAGSLESVAAMIADGLLSDGELATLQDSVSLFNATLRDGLLGADERVVLTQRLALVNDAVVAGAIPEATVVALAAQAELVRQVLDRGLLGPETQGAIDRQVAAIRAAWSDGVIGEAELAAIEAQTDALTGALDAIPEALQRTIARIEDLVEEVAPPDPSTPSATPTPPAPVVPVTPDPIAPATPDETPPTLEQRLAEVLALPNPGNANQERIDRELGRLRRQSGSDAAFNRALARARGGAFLGGASQDLEVTIPPGFPGDTFLAQALVSSGERLQVLTPAQARTGKDPGDRPGLSRGDGAVARRLERVVDRLDAVVAAVETGSRASVEAAAGQERLRDELRALREDLSLAVG